MKTFAHLVEEVQKPGLCHHCGGCVTFCTAVNYGALEVDEDGRPRYKDSDKCIECGLCYLICPEIHELDDETRSHVSWNPPIGHVFKTTLARAKDPEVRNQATDGGVVTGLLLHLLNKGYIDGAIVTKPVGPFQRQPWLARTREDILAAAGFHFDTSQGMKLFSETYSTYSPSMAQLGQVARQRLNRIAFVGTPCQINTLRRMQVLGIVPSDAIKYYLGLFCAGNFYFGPEQRRRLETLGHFNWAEVSKVNVKEELLIHVRNQGVRTLPLQDLDFMKRHACRYCNDYSAEFADLSFGGIGAPEGWTTVITRTPQGRALLDGAVDVVLEKYPHKAVASQALDKVLEWSEQKKQRAAEQHRKLEIISPGADQGTRAYDPPVFPQGPVLS
jgi:coenzyme F420 hydrogenase subunit beta